MKREFLTKELGLSKEMTDKIMAQYGESVNSLKKDNENLLSENETLKASITESNEAKERAGALEAMNKELSDSVEQLTKELENKRTDDVISEKLILSGARNLKAVSALIDKSKITVEDGIVSGLTEQIETLKNDCDYLFYKEQKSSGMRHTSSPDAQDGFVSYARAGAKLN